MYSSIPPQVRQERKEASKDDIVHTEEDEMGGYDVIPFMLKPLEEGEKEPMVNDNYALLKDVSTASQKMETQFDYTYATVDKKRERSANETSTSLVAAEDHLPQPTEESPVEDAEEEEEATSSAETAVDQLYAQVDKKKQKSKEKEVCPEESGAVFEEIAPPPTHLPSTHESPALIQTPWDRR